MRTQTQHQQRARVQTTVSHDVTVTSRDGSTRVLVVDAAAHRTQVTSTRQPLAPGQRQRILRRDRGLCRYCGRGGRKMHVDHVVPVSRGGTNDDANLVTACKTCNLKKGAREGWVPRPIPRSGRARIADVREPRRPREPRVRVGKTSGTTPWG